MAGGMDLGSPRRGGKKPLDTSINLVPFIDLMAVLISFLLLTAAWNQTGRMKAQSGGEGEGDRSDHIPLSVALSRSQLKLVVGGAVSELTFARDERGRLKVDGLKTRLGEVRGLVGTRRDLTLVSDDDVRYEDLVHVMDTCIGSGFDDVQVSPAVN